MKGIGEGMKGWKILVFIVSAALLAGSCTKTSEFTIGRDFLESQTTLEIVDTFRVDMSTIIYDSLASQGTSLAYVGHFGDNIFGSVSCESYFDLAYEAFTEIEERAEYDSAAFILEYTNKYYGDTTAIMDLAIHRLTEKIVPVDGSYLFTTSAFDYESQPMGTATFYPAPESSDTAVSVSVNEFGEELFNLIRNKDVNVSTQEWFEDYIKGFILKSGSAENKAVLGFHATANRLVLKIYYHLRMQEPEKKEITIKMGNTSHQFNNVKPDFTGTPLSNIKNEGNKLPSASTGNQVFMQGLVGLFPKFRFPTLQNLLGEDRWKILKAELVFTPVKFSNSQFSLPDSLYLFSADKENVRSSLRDGQNRPLMADFEYDEIFQEDTRYVFNVTSFIVGELADAWVDYENALMVGLDQENLQGSFERLQIESKSPPVKLRLYYLSY